MKKILITGKNSYIGNSFVAYLQTKNADISADTVSLRNGALKTMDFRGYDCIFHVAGIAHADIGAATEEEKKRYYEVNRDLTIACAEKAKEAGVSQFIFMSSVIVYGDHAGLTEQAKTTEQAETTGQAEITEQAETTGQAETTEQAKTTGQAELSANKRKKNQVCPYRRITSTTPVGATNFYGDSKVAAEQGLLALNDDTFHVVILRAPMIYGPGSKGNYPLMAKLARRLPVFPKISNERSMLYVENLMQFVCLMIQNEEQGIFFPQNERTVSTCDMVAQIAAAHGKKIHFTRFFNPLLRLLGHTNTKPGRIIQKAFGSLVIDESLSRYREAYCLYGLEESVRRTEQSALNEM